MLTAHSLCWLCHLPLALAHWGICSRCCRALRSTAPRCPRCGLPARHATLPCGRCLRSPPPWQHLVAVNDYQPPLSGLIHQLKFAGKPEVAAALARLLLLEVRQRAVPIPDALLSVPLWQTRQWRRGYNQSALLCTPLARWLGCRPLPRVLRRVRNTPAQHHLSARLRKQNLKAAFRLDIPLSGLHIAVVDDVVTTGATVAGLSRLLLQSGAASVQVWCLCRTL